MIQNKTYKTVLIKGTGISVLLFGVLVWLSYIVTVSQQVNFKLGFPYIFYYQFMVDRDIQHGSMPGKFVLDAFLTWAITILSWLLIKRTTRKNKMPKETVFDKIDSM